MKKKLLTLLIAICMIMSMGILAACGGSSGGESSDSGSGTETAEPAADPEEKFAGDWKLAAAESEGVYMAGNFTELLELSDEGNGNVTLTINANKTGVINLGDESANFTWELKSDDVITITPETETDKVGETADISYKEDALWLTIVQEEKEASLIYTKDGIFAGRCAGVNFAYALHQLVILTADDRLMHILNPCPFRCRLHLHRLHGYCGYCIPEILAR